MDGVTRYTIVPGIAAFAEVLGPGDIWVGDYIWQGFGKIVAGFPHKSRPFHMLPDEVRSRLHEHFEGVFALPYNEREDYLAQRRQIAVDVASS